MGVVYKARDTHLDRTVAIKVLPPEKLFDPDRKQRFVKEARAASALNHPNIVTLHDIRSADGIDFIVMEYATGRTLAQMIPAKGSESRAGSRYGVQIADALALGARSGHHPPRPEAVERDGHRRRPRQGPGLRAGEAARAGIAHRSEDADVAVTDEGMVVGTAAYMSPEQAQGQRGRRAVRHLQLRRGPLRNVDRPAGRLSATRSCRSSRRCSTTSPRAPRSINPLIPADVERAIVRCLRKAPARRYQTMADLKVALEDLVTDSAARSQRSRRPRVHHAGRWLWIALVPVVLAGRLRRVAGVATASPSRTRCAPSR